MKVVTNKGVCKLSGIIAAAQRHVVTRMDQVDIVAQVFGVFLPIHIE